jgi:hypothetical protein
MSPASIRTLPSPVCAAVVSGNRFAASANTVRAGSMRAWTASSEPSRMNGPGCEPS